MSVLVRKILIISFRLLLLAWQDVLLWQSEVPAVEINHGTKLSHESFSFKFEISVLLCPVPNVNATKGNSQHVSRNLLDGFAPLSHHSSLQPSFTLTQQASNLLVFFPCKLETA
jgi:hypothetical protein